MTHRNLIREGLTVPISEISSGLVNEKGTPIKFQLDKNYDPMSGKFPSYHYEDYETRKIYYVRI